MKNSIFRNGIALCMIACVSLSYGSIAMATGLDQTSGGVVNQATDSSTNQASGQTVEQQSNKTTDQATEQASDQTTEQSSDKTSNQTDQDVSEEITESESEEVTDETSEEDIMLIDETGEETAVDDSISIDGNLSDWADVSVHTSNTASVASWKVAYSKDGQYVYFMFTGNTSNQWDYNFLGNRININYADGTSGSSNALQVVYDNGKAILKNGWYGDIAGATACVVNTASSNGESPYYVEFAVPVSYFANTNFTMDFCGESVDSSTIGVFSSQTKTDDYSGSVYTGIAVDGDFSDWDAVTKTEVSGVNGSGVNCFSQVGAVFDGDYFYVYVYGDCPYGAGTHSNGKFAITSDLGYSTLLQFMQDGSVSGIDGAICKRVGYQWEVAIPRSALPTYETSVNFGLYLSEPIISGITNVQDVSGSASTKQTITYDGTYDEWKDYGHTTIQYATAGTHEGVVDGEGALYMDDSKIYGHVVTSMPAHTNEAGGEFSYAVTFTFNSTDPTNTAWSNGAYTVSPRLVAVDAAGNINWYASTSNLQPGEYEFYLFPTSCWGKSSNINNLNENDICLGKIHMTIGKDGRDETEFYLDNEKLAQHFKCDKTDLKKCDAQFGRIGPQWLSCAGTSTGPYLGIAICLLAVGGVYVYRRRKGLPVVEYSPV